jgi:hypothetical protein
LTPNPPIQDAHAAAHPRDLDFRHLAAGSARITTAARITIAIAWVALLAAPIALLVGHLGLHDLSWTRSQISTYAARAPNGAWITAAMLLAALSLLCLGISISSRRAQGAGIFNHIASMTFGVAVSGLLILANFKETAANITQLKKMGFEAIRQQTFHDAGLLLFFYGSAAALAIAGVVVSLRTADWLSRVSGIVVALAGPIAYGALISPWPKYLGFAGADAGMKQRAAFLALWIGGLVLLAAVTNNRQRA